MPASARQALSAATHTRSNDGPRRPDDHVLEGRDRNYRSEGAVAGVLFRACVARVSILRDLVGFILLVMFGQQNYR